MLRYMKFDSNINSFKKKYKILLLFSIILILIILIYNIIINNLSNNEIKIISKNSRRIISNLDNYTETMSDFIVNNNYNSINEVQLEFKEFKEKELEIQKEQLKIQKELKEKELEIQIRKNAIEFLENNYGIKPKHYNLDFFINNNNCIKHLLNLDTDLFSLLLNIDYENLKVSFNYFNDNKEYNNYIERSILNNYYLDDYYGRYYKYTLLINYYENIINNPIYKILKNKLEINYSYIFEEINIINYNDIIPHGYYHKFNIIEENNEYFNYIDNITNKYPYNQICNVNSYIEFTQELRLLCGGYYCLYDFRNICVYKMFNDIDRDKLGNYIRLYVSNIYYILAKNNKYLCEMGNIFQFNYIKIFNEYEYIRNMINLEEIPIIPPIKF